MPQGQSHPYAVFDPLTVKRRQQQELDMYDPGPLTNNPAYHQRLWDWHNQVQKHIPNQPGAFEIHKRMIEAPELIGGPSNISMNPGAYFNPNARFVPERSMPRSGPANQREEAEIYPSFPHVIHTNPRQQLSTPASLVGHEMGHTGHLGLENRMHMAQQQGKTGREFAWQPMFSEAFMNDAGKETQRKGSPYQHKYGFGNQPERKIFGSVDETFAFLLGREAELPAGKTLMDDPDTKRLFDKHPKMFDEYVRAREKVRQSWLKKNK